MKSKILLVDDDPFTRRLFENLFRDGAIELVTATNVAEARTAYDLGDFNLVILDQRLPDGNGLDLFAQMRQLRPRQTALMITGYAQVRDAMRRPIIVDGRNLLDPAEARAAGFAYEGIGRPVSPLDVLPETPERQLELES